MTPLIAESPRDGLVLRWVDPDLARKLEALPEYGTLELHMVGGRVQRNYHIRLSRLDLEQKGQRDG